VADLPDWEEVIRRNPSNRQRILDQDRTTFLATMERWMAAYYPFPDQRVPGLPDDLARTITVPTLIFRSGESDCWHTRATSEALAELIPDAELVDAEPALEAARRIKEDGFTCTVLQYNFKDIAFDPAKPGVMVVFFHGFGATLSRDVLRRQKVPAQVTASGANAVLVAPQFAVDARDGSAGRFWQHGGFSRFLDESAHHLAALRGDPASEEVFRKMPIVMVAYSGGFAPAAFCLRDIASTNRVKGVVLLDAAYGELETYAHWAAQEHKSGGFFVSSYTLSTKAHNNELKHMLASKGVPFSDDDSKVGRGVAFFDTGSDYTHESYVTQAWVEFPIKDVLARIPGVGPSDNVASQSVTLRDRTAARE